MAIPKARERAMAIALEAVKHACDTLISLPWRARVKRKELNDHERGQLNDWFKEEVVVELTEQVGKFDNKRR